MFQCLSKGRMHPFRWRVLALTLSLWVSVLSLSRANQSVTHESNTVLTFPQNFEPPGDGRPDDTRGSGARTGSCSTVAALDSAQVVIANTDNSAVEERRIHAIAPPQNFGLTLQSHPTVFIDFNGDAAPSVMMRLEDEAGDYSERVTLPVDAEREVQGFTLPRDRPPLEVGKNYKWTILVACDGRVNPYHPIFTGWVQRAEETNINEGRSQQLIIEQVSQYMNNGYWYDAVRLLDETLQAVHPGRIPDETLQALWTQLLELSDSH